MPPPATFFAVVNPLAAIMSSAIILPPVWPTLIPKLLMKLSIFWLIFKKAIAHRNQIRTFPAAVSFPTAWTSASVTAAIAGTDCNKSKVTARKGTVSIFFHDFIVTSYNDSGLAIKLPTMLVKRRRHQAFITSRNTWPPNIRHQDLKMLEVL